MIRVPNRFSTFAILTSGDSFYEAEWSPGSCCDLSLMCPPNGQSCGFRIYSRFPETLQCLNFAPPWALLFM